MEMEEKDLPLVQPIRGVPVGMIQGTEKYIAFADPAEVVVVNENESYAVYKGAKTARLTVKTSGTGNTRSDPVVTLTEVEE